MEQACEAAETSGRWAGTRAWCAARRGELILLARCDAAGAERAYLDALELLPGYFLAREHLAELRAIQGRFEEAWSLYRGLLHEREDAGYRLALADLAERLERPKRARRERDRALASWRREERTGSLAHAHEYVLALVALDEPEATADALEIARAEWSGRRDGLTAEALARAYRRAGMSSEAVTVVEQALDSGARDPGLVEVAVELLRASGRVEEAARLEADRAPCVLPE
jgi:tetratricopeptide (TPR) repeat protein